MEFFHRADGKPFRLGVLPGTFNPPTIAHWGLAQAALGPTPLPCGRGSETLVDEVVFVLPRVFPHKTFQGASFDERIELIRAMAGGHARCSIASADGGLFAEIAEECRESYGPAVRLTFLCGCDAAERIAAWDYGDPAAFARMLRKFDLLVASRGGDFEAPAGLKSAIKGLPLPEELQMVSATEVRNRVREGLPWEHLVPEAIRDRVREIYTTGRSD